jgi:hypothetical protein
VTTIVARTPQASAYSGHRSPHLPRTTHLVSLAVIGCFLFVHLRGQWFWWDEFEYLGSSRDGYAAWENLLRPHNEHWSALTGLTYAALRDSVGLGSYWPYLLPVVAVHLLAAHLLWRVMIRLRANPWIAMGLTALFALGGAGYENVVWAFQLAFVASTACGLASVLVLLGPGPLSLFRRAALASLTTINLAISGVGLVWLIICGILLLLRRDKTTLAAATLAVPVSVYLIWSYWFGVSTAGRTIEGWSFVATMLEFVFVGLLSTGYRLVGMETQQTTWGLCVALAVVTAVLAAGWACARSADRRSRQAACLALFAPAFFLVASLARVKGVDGVGTAVASRYYYVVLVSILPLAAVQLTVLVQRRRRLIVPLAVGLCLLGSLAGNTFIKGADGWRTDSENLHRTLLAEMDLLESGATAFPENPPEPLRSPEYLTQEDLRRWTTTGEIAPLPLTEVDRATAAAILQIQIRPAMAPSVAACGEGSLRVTGGGQGVTLEVRKEGLVGLSLTDHVGASSRPRYQVLTTGTYTVSSLVAGTLRLTEPEGAAGLCHPPAA